MEGVEWSADEMQILPIPCTQGTLPWQPFLAFYIWGAHLANATEPSMCGGDAALCQITLTTCYYYYYYCASPSWTWD